MSVYTYFRDLKKCDNGIAAIEFALFLPILVTMIVATTEIARYAIIHQKLHKISFDMANMPTRHESLSLATLNAYGNGADQLFEPFDFEAGDGTVIFSSVASVDSSGSGGGPRVRGATMGGGVSGDESSGADTLGRCSFGCVIWQHRARGSEPSRIGAVGRRVHFPQPYDLNGTQDIIVAEVLFTFKPILSFTSTIIPALGERTLYFYALMKGRQGNLMTPPI